MNTQSMLSSHMYSIGGHLDAIKNAIFLRKQGWVVLRPARNKTFDRELRYQNYHGHIPVAYRLYTKGQMRQTDYSDGIRWGKTFLSSYLYALAFMNH